MLSEIASKWRVLSAGLATATAAAALGASLTEPAVPIDDDNERPPIIVNNGSLEIEGDNGFLGLKDGGTWDGSAGVYKHVHPDPGPRFLQLKTSPNKEFCRVGTGAPEKSPFVGSKIAITYGTAAQKYVVTATIVTQDAKNYLQMDFGANHPRIDEKKKRLTVDSERIYSVSIDDGAVTCAFPPNVGDPKVDLKIRQKR
jgi:hypothetical protein